MFPTMIYIYLKAIVLIVNTVVFKIIEFKKSNFEFF